MIGPKKRGHWTGTNRPNGGSRSWEHLRPGEKYAVVAEFRDFDGDNHPVGETWAYLGYAFLPYEDGLSLFVSLDEQQEWHIRLQDRPEEQAQVIRHLADYLQAA